MYDLLMLALLVAAWGAAAAYARACGRLIDSERASAERTQ